MGNVQVKINGLFSWVKWLFVPVGIFAIATFVVEPALSSKIVSDFKEYGVVETYLRAGRSFINKVQTLKDVDQENATLREKIGELEKQIDETRTEYNEKKSKKEQAQISQELKQKTGSDVGLALSAIHYDVPAQLMPHQIYALAVGYLRKEENEPAAVLLTNLIEMQEDKSFQRPEVYLLTAVAWYRLNNWKLANHYTELSLKTGKPNTQVYRQALIWKALSESKLNHHQEAQKILTTIVGNYPHAEETKWINGEFRSIASEDEKDNKHDP